MKNYLVSVIIPVYNGVGNGIEDCLNSVISQDIMEKEIIVIDDFSTDNSNQIINLMLKKTSVNFTIKSHDTNQGLSKSLNEGLNISSGKYILIIQQDCALIGKSELRDSIEYMEKENIKVLVGSTATNFNSLNDYQKLFKIRISETSEIQIRNNKIYITQLKCDLFKAEVFSTIGEFDYVHKTVGQDFVLSSRLFKNNIEMYTFYKFLFKIRYEGEKSFKSICLKEFRYALAVPYISSIWKNDQFLRRSIDIQAKSKVKERLLNIILPFLFLLGFFTFSLYSNNIVLYSIIIVGISWILIALSRIIPVFLTYNKKRTVVFYSFLYLVTDFIYFTGFLVGLVYLIKVKIFKK